MGQAYSCFGLFKAHQNFQIIWVHSCKVDSVRRHRNLANQIFLVFQGLLGVNQYSYVEAHNNSVELTKASKIYKSHS